ncbi:MAG: short-chain dehydrogenase [Paenibacillaceae bacterium]|nr:short-chain dehydrogenase [Paenibacillaceae bacterium]
MEQQRWALVSGTDRGLGLALVKGLLERGYRVFAGLLQEKDGTHEELERNFAGRLRFLQLDITSADSVEQACQAVREVTGSLDILINNAAILGETDATVEDELDFSEMERVFQVNTLGSLRMSNRFVPLVMNSRDRLILNISSEAGSIGDCWRNGWYAYCMSKAALNMQSKLIHNQLAPKGGRVMVVHPGHVRTFMRGELDTAGRLTPDESAGHILGLVDKRLSPDYSGENIVLVDYSGQELPW